MSKLNKDILILIFEELQYEPKSLYSCLLVNRAWCKIIIPILWRNPWENPWKTHFKNLIISHLSNETKEVLKGQGIILPELQQKPLFNYISFCRYLDLNELEKKISTMGYIEESKMSIIRNEIFKLFINANTKLTHLCIPEDFDDQIHLIPGAERCFSELKFLGCYSNINQNILEGLIRINKSIKELRIDNARYVNNSNNSGIIKLIEAQQNLNSIHLMMTNHIIDHLFYITLENSLIRHAHAVQYFKIDYEPFTDILSYLVNLIGLEFGPVHARDWSNLRMNLRNISLPNLRILKAQSIPSDILISLIKNTNGHLTEVSLPPEPDNSKLIKSIYQNCPNLKYFGLTIHNLNISEFEKLIIKCHSLTGLVITTNRSGYLWDNIFKILTKSSPASLFKFKFNFHCYRRLRSESLKLFFDNWKDRNPMLIQIYTYENFNYAYFIAKITHEFSDLIEKYKAEGIVKEYDNSRFGSLDFKWRFG